MKRKKAEENLQIAVSRYIRYQYPDVIFTCECSGIFLPIGQSVQLKKQRSESKLPDMLILEPRGNYAGLMLELKKDGHRLVGGGLPKDAHTIKQLALLKRLSAKGYKAVMVVGFDEARAVIDDYLRKITITINK